MESNIEVHSLFPEPVVITSLEREFTKTEMDTFKMLSKDTVKNRGNRTSVNSYVLDLPELKELKDIIEEKINMFVNAVLQTTPHKMRLTQSWTNYTDVGEHHHDHYHTNSYVSGVLYIDANREHDKIHFIHPKNKPYLLTTQSYNMYNSESWYFKVGTGDIILFMSHMSHFVSAEDIQSTRISLAFNSFFDCTIGSKTNLNELKL